MASVIQCVIIHSVNKMEAIVIWPQDVHSAGSVMENVIQLVISNPVIGIQEIVLL